MTDPIKKESKDFFMEYLDQRFDNLHLELKTITKNQESTDLSVKEIAHIVETMRVLENNKCVKCESTKEIKGIKTEMESMKTGLSEVLFIKKYSRQFVMAGVLSILMFLSGSTAIIIEVKKWITDDAKQEVRVETNAIKTEILTKKVDVNTKVINHNAEVQKGQLKREDEKK